MKLCGHTMGVPSKDIFQAIDFFKSLGYQGVEVRCASVSNLSNGKVNPVGQINPEEFDNSLGKRILNKLQEKNMKIACLTPYHWDYVHSNVRDRSIEGMKKAVKIAKELDCKRVRAFGGIEPSKEISYKETWDKTVSGLQEVGRFARDYGINICIETHGGTLTQCAKESLKMVKDINLENVGILYDYKWIDLCGMESMKEATNMLKPYIKHVHLGNHIVPNREKNKRYTSEQVKPTLLEEGEIDLKELLKALKSIGYEDYLSDEYEKLWHDAFPDAEVGMRKNIKYLEKLLLEI